MKKTTILVMAALLCGAAAPAFAATSTEDFVKTAAIANKFEIDSSKVALDRSKDADVRKFAQEMVDDHTKAGEGLVSAVSQAKLDPNTVPKDLDDKHQKLLDKLKNDKEADFDKDYIDDQTDAHKDAVDLFGGYAKSGDNDVIKNFAATTLPVLQKHKDHIKQLKDEKK